MSRQHPVDVLVGKRIRMRRLQMSLSQSDLANALRLTFQQVQKYEKGSNRVSCSRLYEIAQALDVPITYFFEEQGGNFEARASEQLDARDLKAGMRLVAAFGKLSDDKTRRKFIELIDSVVASRGRAAGR